MLQNLSQGQVNHRTANIYPMVLRKIEFVTGCLPAYEKIQLVSCGAKHLKLRNCFDAEITTDDVVVVVVVVGGWGGGGCLEHLYNSPNLITRLQEVIFYPILYK